MNEDNQYPNNENQNQGSNLNSGGDNNTNQYGNSNQYQDQNSGQNQYIDPNQNQYVNQNQGQYTEQDKYWNQNQNANSNPYQNQYANLNQNQFGNQNQYGNQQTPYGNQNSTPKKPKSKKFVVSIISAIFALLIVGGGVFAFFNMQKTPKDQLLLAELNSWNQLSDAFENRYKPEIEWAKKAETTPTEYTYDIGAYVNGDFYSYEEMMFAEILGNSTLSLNVQTDPNKQLMKADMEADINGVTIDQLSAYITTEEVMVGFPFSDDILQVKDGDFGDFMRTLDPYYEGSDSLGLSDWMGKNMFSEENKEYLVKEYLLFFYNSLPTEAFKESSEDIEVFGENLKATKISMELSGDQIKDSLLKVLEKAKDDPKFEAIIMETVTNIMGAAGTIEEDLNLDINEGLESAIEELKDTDIPNGIKYTVWVNSDTVVQSEFEIGDEFKVEGTRQFTNDKQQWDYVVEVEGEKVYFTGDLSSKDGEFEDEVTLIDDYETGFTYEGSEELVDGERTFERSLYFTDGYDDFELYWIGDTSYDGDSMEGTHTIGIGTYEFDIEISFDEVGKFIKNVKIPTDNIVDIGSMSEDEIQAYMEEEFLFEAQSWFMDLYFELGLY